ncbi:RHS repeat-associated core domain-containing protein [Phaeocystidibacter marisrubri]|uniref:RHS repeat-associated core domain-containing protein n=1 Tax=Phaeocystidibacter marisrubri TaxID=1577780 RepID=UPI0019A674E2|nr:RHS repeat-associated core domain-containing protein [Phaeocystidibacter marisrubri]GGH69903.1 hypothetical protein GCM10011318_11410 [Phaeocystidibacter marisrubri]
MRIMGRARYYDNRLSTWLSVDPLAANGPNITPYAFSHNNPIMMVDPDGNWPFTPLPFWDGWLWGDRYPGVTTTFTEAKVSAGAFVGANLLRQAGVARDEVGVTHFTSRTEVFIDPTDMAEGEEPELYIGAMAHEMAGISQDPASETFLEQYHKPGWQASAGGALGLAGGIGFGPRGITLMVGVGVGVELSVMSTDIVESISLTYDEVQKINPGDLQWGVTDVRINSETGRRMANVTVGTGSSKRVTEQVVYSYFEENVWMSADYQARAEEIREF